MIHLHSTIILHSIASYAALYARPLHDNLCRGNCQIRNADLIRKAYEWTEIFLGL